MLEPIKWDRNQLHLLDQRKLPHETVYITCTKYKEVALAIKGMVVRGAPAIGIAAAYGMVMAIQQYQDLDIARTQLRNARPTAVNLQWALERMMKIWDENTVYSQMKDMMEAEAILLHTEDETLCRAIGDHGSALLPQDASLYHHCNTGALATGGWGTALGVVRTHHAAGGLRHVYVGETRPRLQGARLTTYELNQESIQHTLVVDSAFGLLAMQGKVDAVLVGADRVASNGDVANKIGTYSLAVIAAAHGIPFYVCFPYSTYDAACSEGSRIHIEERSWEEIVDQKPRFNSRVYNPAFDITPSKYITAYVTEHGSFRNAEDLAERMKQ